MIRGVVGISKTYLCRLEKVGRAPWQGDVDEEDVRRDFVRPTRPREETMMSVRFATENHGESPKEFERDRVTVAVVTKTTSGELQLRRRNSLSTVDETTCGLLLRRRYDVVLRKEALGVFI